MFYLSPKTRHISLNFMSLPHLQSNVFETTKNSEFSLPTSNNMSCFKPLKVSDNGYLQICVAREPALRTIGPHCPSVRIWPTLSYGCHSNLLEGLKISELGHWDSHGGCPVVMLLCL